MRDEDLLLARQLELQTAHLLQLFEDQQQLLFGEGLGDGGAVGLEEREGVQFGERSVDDVMGSAVLMQDLRPI